MIKNLGKIFLVVLAIATTPKYLYDILIKGGLIKRDTN